MEVRQDDDSVHDLGQRPAVCALRQALDVLFGQQPGPVREDLVDVVDGAQLGRDELEPVQPLHVAALGHELLLVQAHQVVAVVARGRHDGQVVARRERQRPVIVHQIAVRLDVVLEILRVVANHLRHVVVHVQVALHEALFAVAVL